MDKQEKKIRRLQDALNDVVEALGYGHPTKIALSIASNALIRDPMEEEVDG